MELTFMQRTKFDEGATEMVCDFCLEKFGEEDEK